MVGENKGSSGEVAVTGIGLGYDEKKGVALQRGIYFIAFLSLICVALNGAILGKGLRGGFPESTSRVESNESLVSSAAVLPTATSKLDAKETYVDQDCVDFCEHFNKYCPASNMFLFHNEGRELVTTKDEELARIDSAHESDASAECQKTCMLWPRGQDPATYDLTLYGQTNGNIHNSNWGGDTFWCRKRHMSIVGSLKDASVHCSHASNSGTGVCRDALVNGYTPYELLRDGLRDRHHFGYCDLSRDDTIADCTNNFDITDETLVSALKMMPATVEIIFLNGLPGITKLSANIFSDNLKKPGILQAIYANDCGIETIDADALGGLGELKIFNADNNPSVQNIPEDLFKDTPKLLQFSMFFAGVQAIPAGLFQNTPDIERIFLHGIPTLTEFAPGTFDGLTKLQILRFVLCGFHDNSFPEGLFKDLVSLQFFDFFGNPGFTTFKKSWFDGGWGKNILRIEFMDIPTLVTIDEGAFETLDSLERVYFHNTGVKYINPDIFKDKENFVNLSI